MINEYDYDFFSCVCVCVKLYINKQIQKHKFYQFW